MEGGSNGTQARRDGHHQRKRFDKYSCQIDRWSRARSFARVWQFGGGSCLVKCRSRGEAKRRRGEKESLVLLSAPEIYGIFQLRALKREGPSPTPARRRAWVAGNGDALTELRCREVVARPKKLAREKHAVDLGACRNHDRLVHLAGEAGNGVAKSRGGLVMLSRRSEWEQHVRQHLPIAFPRNRRTQTARCYVCTVHSPALAPSESKATTVPCVWSRVTVFVI